MKLEELARKLDAELRGAGDTEIISVAGIEQAKEGDITFVANRKYFSKIKSCKASAIILSPEDPAIALPSLRIANPYLAFARSLDFFYKKPQQAAGIHPTAVIDPTAEIGEGASIGAYVTIGAGVRIGKNATLYPHVVIYPGVTMGEDVKIYARAVLREEVVIGNRVIIQDGVVVGADGFGFAPRGDGTYHKILQAGSVIIEDDVEIGANSAIDRATIGHTIIRRGTKIDNLVQIGHGSSIGQDCLIAAQTGVAGSAVIGNRVILAGQVGVVGHLTIGDNSIVTAQTGVAGSLPENSKVSGSPAFDSLAWKKCSFLIPKLPDYIHRLRRIEKKLNISDEDVSEGKK